ncbi:MAG: hypothetical protein ACLP01_04495 [Solirubrobacteraceae bacterium]
MTTSPAPSATIPTPVSASKTRGLRIDASDATFAALLMLGAAIVLYETRGLSFFFDDWEFILDRRGISLDMFLLPHGPHLSALPILIYKIVLQLFGASSYVPLRMLAALDIVALGLITGIACRRLWGRWWGLVPVALLMTLGSGAISLLWSFQVGYSIADVAGLLSLMALSRRSPRGDAIACGALIVSLASASQGVGFLAGATVLVILRGNWRQSIWIVAVPAVLYGLWYLKYGHQNSETYLSLWRGSLVYVAQAFSSTLAGVSGLSTPTTDLPPQIDPSFGEPLALAAIVVLVIALWRGWRPPPLFWAAATTLVVLWLAASVSDLSGNRRPTDSRYLATNVMLLSVCVCAAVPRPRRLKRGGTIAVLAGLGIVCVTNAGQFTGMRNEMLSASVASRAELGGLLILRGLVPPDFSPAPPFLPGLINDVAAGTFYSAVDAFGTNADTPEQLLFTGEGTRELADQVIERGELIALRPTSTPAPTAAKPPGIDTGTAKASGGCLILGRGAVAIDLPAGAIQLTAAAGQPVTAAIARFATAYAIALGQVAAGTTATVRVPADRAPEVSWHMLVQGPGGRVCTVAG